MGTGVARDDIGWLRFVCGITHACVSWVSDDPGIGGIPRRALNAGSICPPEATRTASITFSSTLGNASLRVVLASSLGLSGRGGMAGGAALTVPVAMDAADGVGSRLLSSELLTC
jgi:hypothetical protein